MVLRTGHLGTEGIVRWFPFTWKRPPSVQPATRSGWKRLFVPSQQRLEDRWVPAFALLTPRFSTIAHGNVASIE